MRFFSSAIALALLGPFLYGCEKGAASTADSSSAAGAPSTLEVVEPGKTLPAQIVMGWVPHYGIAPGLKALKSTYGKTEVINTLDRIGLQFWTLNVDGTITNLQGANDEDVKPFLALAAKHDIKVLLTVTNDAGSLNAEGTAAADRLVGFHWGTVRQAFKAVGPDGVAQALLDVVEKTNLDGIDLDFEAGGVGKYTAKDREDFAQLVSILSLNLKEKSQLLTVDTFPGTNKTLVPNINWWEDWQGKVDSLHAMGYENTYKNGRGDANYQQLQDAALEAGFQAEQLIVGVPVWLNKWAGGENNIGYSHQENIEYLAHCLKQPSGVALWALQHPEAHTITETNEKPWTTDAPWAELKKLHDGQEQRISVCAAAEDQENLIDNFLTPESNRLGGRWFASSDFYDRTDTDNASRVLTEDGSYDMALGEGWWGKIDRGYSEVDGVTYLSGIVEINGAIDDNAGFGGVWMEFMPRDCSQLDDPSDGCGWRVEALVGQDLSAHEELVVGMSCQKDKEFLITLDTKEGVLAKEGPWGTSIKCSGNSENYRISLKDPQAVLGGTGEFDPSQATRLRVEFQNKKPSSASFSLTGIALDQDVIK